MLFRQNEKGLELKNVTSNIVAYGTSIIVFEDPGMDDALMHAQVNALCKNILGYIPCAGNTDLEFTKKNALLINEMTEHKSIPVYPGASHPSQVTDEPENAKHVFGKTGFGKLELPNPIIDSQIQSGFEFAVKAIKNAKEPITLVSTGGLTDVAMVLSALNKNDFKNIAAISIMGGVLDLGQSNAPLSALAEGKMRWAEFNIIYDPDSSKLVFKIAEENNLPIFLSPLDLTHKVTYKKEQVNSLRKVGNYVAKVMSDLMGDVTPPYLKRFGSDNPQQPAHDLNASMAVFHPELYTTKRGYISVDGEESSTRGRTTFNQSSDGNVYVLDMPQERLNQFFKYYERDLEAYNTPRNIILGYLYDIKSSSQIDESVSVISKIIQDNQLNTLDLSGLLITAEINNALIKIVENNPTIISVIVSAADNREVTQLCERNIKSSESVFIKNK